MPHISHICQLVYAHIWPFNVSIYTLYEPTAISNVSRKFDTHTFFILACVPEQICMPPCTCVALYCYCCCWTYKQSKTAICNSHLPSYCHMFWQQICPLNASYMPHMPICSCLDIRELCQYIYLMRTQCNQHYHQSTGIQFKLLEYAPDHICLPHHTCMSHCTSNIVYMKTPHYYTYKLNETMNCNFIII